MPALTLESCRIVYDDTGAGLPVLFLHGFPLRRSLWAPQVGVMAQSVRCIVPDLRGLGASSPAPPWSMDQYADDAAALLDALGIAQAVVCGLSMGGYVAFAFWRRHAHRVRALALVDTRAGADSAEGRQKRLDMMAMAHEGGAPAVANAMLPGMLGKSTRERAPDLVDDVRSMLVAAPVPGILGALEALMHRPDSTPTMETITVPTLIVVGAEDVLTPPRDAEVMHHGIHGSRLEIFEGAGHLSNLERPAAFNHVLQEWLATLS